MKELPSSIQMCPICRTKLFVLRSICSCINKNNIMMKKKTVDRRNIPFKGLIFNFKLVWKNYAAYSYITISIELCLR